MSWQQQAVFWSLALLAAALILYMLGPILLPFVAGAAIAYLLDPVARRLERLGLGRLGATVLILSLAALAFILLLVVLVPVVLQQGAQFIERIPAYASRLSELFRDLGARATGVPWLREALGIDDATEDAGELLHELAGQATEWLGQLARQILTGGLAFISLMALIVVTPVVAFFLLNDWDRLVARVDSWVPRDHVETVRRLAQEIDSALAGFVRGQALLCLILGVFYGTSLTLLGLNFGLMIGLVAGLISFIPYIGSILGFVVAVAVALVQFWPDWPWIVAVAGVFIAGNLTEGNILQPKLVGSQVGLHPVWLIFAVLAFGYLFGFVGLLLAVPLAAALGVLSRFALEQYLASPIYHPNSDDAEGPRT